MVGFKRAAAIALAFLFVIGMAFTGAVPARAATVKVVVDGYPLSLDVSPVVERGRVLVPLRPIFEALGAQVSWDKKTKTVAAIRGARSVRLTVGQAVAYRNGVAVSLDVPAGIKKGRVLVPLRFVSEALGAEVNWNPVTSTVTVARKREIITITDSLGRKVSVPSPPQRIVVVNSDVAEVICALGAADKIVGVSDTTDFPPLLKQKAKVGPAFTPSVEKIIALRPDIVFGYGKFLKAELAKQIEQAGIPVVYLDCYKINTMVRDVETLGAILGREKAAREYAAYFQRSIALITGRTKSLPPAAKPLVYVEGYTDYSTVSAGSGGAEFIEMAGGVNIAAGEPVPYPKVSPEWVVAENPQVIIKAAASSVPNGYGAGPEGLKALREKLLARPGWASIRAVKDGRVYVLSSEIYTGPRSFVGLAYFAKWLHPKLFADLDPDALHRDVLKRFHGLELKGAYVCPALSK